MEEHPGCQYQSKIEKAQKINGILNIFGVYNLTNNQMYTHSYRKKTGKQFLDFIKQINQKYNSDIKQIFLVLDNISIHKCKKVRETIQKYYPRIYVSIFTNQGSRIKPDRSKMDVDAKTSSKQFYI